MTINLSVSDPAEADRIFAAFAEGGAVGMPIQETFWALRFGVVTDRFNIPWMINCEKAP
jgi:PhnB protein